MKKTLKKILPWVILGVAIRLLLMPITLHPDLWAVSFSEYLFSFKGVFNIYDYLASLPATSAINQNYGANFFTYPPLAYYTFGVLGLILKPFFNHDFFANLAQNLPVVLNNNRLFWHLFLTKLPYLFFDGGILVLLTKLFAEEKKKKLAVILWLFNPLVLYTTYMIGQFDIIPVFFTVLALYLAKEKKLAWAALALGVGGAYKMFPLFFVPFLAFSLGINFKRKAKLLILGLLPYLLSIAPFISSAVFRQNVLFSNQSQKMFFAKIPVSGGEYLSVFVVIYIFLLVLSLFKKVKLWKWFLAVMLVFFSVTHYHPQWFLWITPFLVILWASRPDLNVFPIVFFLCWFSIMIFFEPSLSLGLFTPIYHSLANIVPFSDIFSRFYDVFQFKSLVRSVFAGISLASVLLLLSHEEDK